MRPVDLLNKRFGFWLVKSKAPNNQNSKTQWVCECECGITKIITTNSLVTNNSTSCGCNRMVNLVGFQFSDLTVVAPDYSSGHRKWLCRCSCGLLVVSSVGELNSRNKISCSGLVCCPMSMNDSDHKPFVMVIDDDIDLCETMVSALNNDGYAATFCPTASLAIPIVVAGDFDVIITDVAMPHIDGIELCKRVLERKPHMSIIVMTGNASVDVAVEAVRAGACDFITKPFTVGELAQSIDRAKCRPNHRQKTPSRRPAPPITKAC